MMLPLALAALGALALLVWHLRRPAPAVVQLSFARFLPEPPPAPRQRGRLALVPPVRSLAFWLRMLAAGLALGALVTSVERPAPGASLGIGLRVVVDVSHSMGLPKGDGTRLDAALAQARAALERVQGIGATLCTEAVLAGAGPGPRGPVETVLAAARVRPEGADPAALLAAAEMEPDGCAITHVLVLTDRRRPAIPGTEGTAPVYWHQIGAPAWNAGIAEVTALGPDLAGRPGALVVQVRQWGEAPALRLTLEGPGGSREVPLVPSVDRPDRLIARIALPGPGEHRLRLAPGGAYPADDLVRFSLATAPLPTLDWRLTALPPPRGSQRGAGLVVVPVAGLDPAVLAGPVLAVYDGWQTGAPGPSRIGAFVEAPDLTEAIHLDRFEALSPQPLAMPLPPGFVPVLTEAGTGLPFVARRASPPGLILPAPVLTAGDEQRALSLTLFFNGLAALVGSGTERPALTWLDPAGATIRDAWKASDTNRPLDPPDPFDPTPAPRPDPTEPVWPLLLALALAALLAERLAAVRLAMRKPVDAV